MLKKILTALICFFTPNRLTFWMLNLLGHHVASSAKIGFSFIWLNGKLVMKPKSRIGNFNRIQINNLELEESAYIGKFNNLTGPFDVQLAITAAIGNANSISRAPLGVTYGKSTLKLGILSKITANHRLDCTRNIIIGNYTTIAGHDSQFWTHAYYHDMEGPGRFRLDGEILIGDNVYIGSRCVINCGVKVANAVIVGANACISKSLNQTGTYVNQPLRFIERDLNVKDKFNRVDGYSICEDVYEKKLDN